MDRNRAGKTTIWQRKAEADLEAGQTSVIGLGPGAFRLENTADLLALNRLARRRLGTVGPCVVVGGDGTLWLLALVQWQERAARLPAGPVLFAGNDSATYAATLDVTAPPQNRTDRLWGVSWLPPGMQWMLTPASQPDGEGAGLEALPFSLNPSTFSQYAPLLSARRSPADLPVTWVAIVLAVALVIASVLA